MHDVRQLFSSKISARWNAIVATNAVSLYIFLAYFQYELHTCEAIVRSKYNAKCVNRITNIVLVWYKKKPIIYVYR